ncbi:MAG: PA0069 family radical SAM protein [Pseudomonadota bacterium]
MPKNSHSADPGARGRAARSNRPGRFERHDRDLEWDGWDIEDDIETVRTEISEERPRKVITRNTSPDIPFDRSINPYRGCEHGCIYCFARPTHAYLGLSPGLDFETRLIARPDAANVLETELRAPSYKPAVIAIGTNTDPYQPIEGRYKIMREILEVFMEYRHPVGVVTKGTLIERDADLLGEMGRMGLARVGVSITTLDPVVSRKMEPRVPSPKRRLAVIRRLTDAGCPVRVMASPMIPGLTDHELEAILRAGADAGAVAASWIMLRLPREVAPLFAEWLTEHFPDRAKRVLSRVKDVHGGQLYDPAWGRRMTGQGVFADLLRHRFDIEAKRLGLDRALPRLRTDLFQCPTRRGEQMSLF